MISEKEFLTNDYISELLKTGKWSAHGAFLDLYVYDTYEYIIKEKIPSEFDWLNILREDPFKKHFLNWLPQRFRYAKEWLEKDLSKCKTDDGLYLIKRKIFCDQDFLSKCIKKDTDIGRFWCSNYPEAYSVSEKEPELIDLIVDAKISLKDIDLIETMRSRMDYTNGDMENEIYVKKDAMPIFIKLYYSIGKEIKEIDCINDERLKGIKEKISNG